MNVPQHTSNEKSNQWLTWLGSRFQVFHDTVDFSVFFAPGLDSAWPWLIDWHQTWHLKWWQRAQLWSSQTIDPSSTLFQSLMSFLGKHPGLNVRSGLIRIVFVCYFLFRWIKMWLFPPNLESLSHFHTWITHIISLQRMELFKKWLHYCTFVCVCV